MAAIILFCFILGSLLAMAFVLIVAVAVIFAALQTLVHWITK